MIITHVLCDNNVKGAIHRDEPESAAPLSFMELKSDFQLIIGGSCDQ